MDSASREKPGVVVEREKRAFGSLQCTDRLYNKLCYKRIVYGGIFCGYVHKIVI